MNASGKTSSFAPFPAASADQTLIVMVCRHSDLQSADVVVEHLAARQDNTELTARNLSKCFGLPLTLERHGDRWSAQGLPLG